MERRPQQPESGADALRRRFSQLSEASLRINESLDLETVLQYVVDSSRILTGARYSGITTIDSAGQRETAGISPHHWRFALTPMIRCKSLQPCGLEAL